jgi:hypothetical protein
MGSLAAFRKERTDFPSQIRLGGTYSFSLGEIVFRAASGLSSELGLSVNHAHFGAEATYNQVVTARFGYQTGIDARGFSAGMGIRYSVVVIDYAYVPFSMLMGNAHIISIGFIL